MWSGVENRFSTHRFWDQGECLATMGAHKCYSYCYAGAQRCLFLGAECHFNICGKTWRKEGPAFHRYKEKAHSQEEAPGRRSFRIWGRGWCSRIGAETEGASKAEIRKEIPIKRHGCGRRREWQTKNKEEEYTVISSLITLSLLFFVIPCWLALCILFPASFIFEPVRELRSAHEHFRCGLPWQQSGCALKIVLYLSRVNSARVRSRYGAIHHAACFVWTSVTAWHALEQTYHDQAFQLCANKSRGR